LIEDGATIQTGIGKVPGQVLKALSQRRNLRIHSGIVLPGARDLVEGGVIEGVGTIVAASGAGDQAFYDWLEQSREVTLAEVSETHDLAKLIGIPKLTAINSAIEVDMLGQCNTEMVGGRYVSSAGGLPEFTIGAHKAKGGKSIIALPATDRKGKASRIVSRFAAGTPIAVPRHAVDFVVTEFGVADFRGKSAQARAEALIAIASPAFQADLASSYGSRDA
jgi:acyl-CoA hydrolase